MLGSYYFWIVLSLRRPFSQFSSHLDKAKPVLDFLDDSFFGEAIFDTQVAQGTSWISRRFATCVCFLLGSSLIFGKFFPCGDHFYRDHPGLAQGTCIC